MGKRRPSRLHHPARSLIGIHQMHAEAAKMVGRRALAAANAAGEAENPGFHGEGPLLLWTHYPCRGYGVPVTD
ncbi:hypothetical protein D3C71_2145780 [compost metagenome]